MCQAEKESIALIDYRQGSWEGLIATHVAFYLTVGLDSHLIADVVSPVKKGYGWSSIRKLWKRDGT